MDRNHLILEYQALANETKRKHPEVREAAEKAINILRPLQVDIRTDSRLSDDILFPILLGCKTKNPKVVATAIGALQRLIGLGGLPERLVPSALQVLGEALTAGLDSQLKILQVLLFVLKYCEGIHGDLLGQVSPTFLPGEAVWTDDHGSVTAPAGPAPLLSAARFEGRDCL